jgi:hypothetical protein
MMVNMLPLPATAHGLGCPASRLKGKELAQIWNLPCIPSCLRGHGAAVQGAPPPTPLATRLSNVEQFKMAVTDAGAVAMHIMRRPKFRPQAA